MQRIEIANLYKNLPQDGQAVTLCGWAKTIRDSKKIGFIELTDGSCFKSLQVVFQADKLENYTEIAKAGTYTSLEVKGRIVLTPQAKQPFEVNADEITILGSCPSDYPLQKKRHSVEFLRTMPHLRPRTNTFSAAFRVRSAAAYAIHRFFQEQGFVYVHTPIFTGSDCEGAGEMFRVTTLDLNNVYLLAGNTFTGLEIRVMLIGMVVAFVVSLLAIGFLMRYVKKHSFRLFGWYRIALGVLVLGVFFVQGLLA